MLLDIDKVTLFKQGVRHMQVWAIEVEGDALIIQYGVEGGATQEQIEHIEGGKGGRTLWQQINSRFKSRVNKQKLQGYKPSREEALKGPSNAMGLPQPMLAQVYSKVKADISNAFIQYKYDGNRCLITRRDNELIAYSRRGKVIDTIDHILESVDLEEGQTIDGELYSHGATLQEIVSWVRKAQPGTKKIKFHAYDLISIMKYEDRWAALEGMKWGEFAEVIPTWHMSKVNSLDKKFEEARDEGYEGLILRVGDSGYEVNKRSKSLLKVKQFFDAEFQCISMHLSKAGVPMAKCSCQGGTFDVVLPGTYEEKGEQFINLSHYINQLLTVEFSGYTKDQIPFQPIAKTWRIE